MVLLPTGHFTRDTIVSAVRHPRGTLRCPSLPLPGSPHQVLPVPLVQSPPNHHSCSSIMTSLPPPSWQEALHRRTVFHTAAKDPTSPPGARPRFTIEVNMHAQPTARAAAACYTLLILAPRASHHVWYTMLSGECSTALSGLQQKVRMQAVYGKEADKAGRVAPAVGGQHCHYAPEAFVSNTSASSSAA